ncbi:MAG: MFS transporter [Salinigranum sp.]
MTGERTLLADPRLHAILSLAAMGVMGGTLVSPTLPGMATSLGVSGARIGLVMTAFFAPAAVAIPIVGALADARGRRPIILASLFVYGAAGVAVGLAGSFSTVLVLRAIQGCAFPGLLPLSTAVIGDVYEGVDATRAQGFRTSMNGLGGIVAPAVAGVAAGVSWRVPYWLFALSFLALALCYVALPEATAAGGTGERGDRVDGDGSSPDGDESPTAGDGDPTARGDGSSGVRSRIGGAAREAAGALTAPVLKLIGATFVVFFVRFGLVTFVPLYVVSSLGASDAVGGFAVALTGLGRFVVAPTAGRLVERSARRTVLFGGLCVFALGTGLLLFAPGPWTFLASIGVLSVGEGAFNPVANDFVTSATPAAVRGRVVGLLEVGKTVAVAASPVAFGAVLAVGSYRAMFLLGGLLVAGMAALVGSGVGEGGAAAALNDELTAE